MFTFSGHSNSDAFLVATKSAVVTIPWIDGTFLVSLADIALVLNQASSKEFLASFTGVNSKVNAISNVSANLTQHLSFGRLDSLWLFFTAHSGHEASLVTTILASNAALFGNVTVTITLAGEGRLALLCAADVKALAWQTDQCTKIVPRRLLSTYYTDFLIFVIVE